MFRSSVLVCAGGEPCFGVVCWCVWVVNHVSDPGSVLVCVGGEPRSDTHSVHKYIRTFMQHIGTLINRFDRMLCAFCPL